MAEQNSHSFKFKQEPQSGRSFSDHDCSPIIQEET